MPWVHAPREYGLLMAVFNDMWPGIVFLVTGWRTSVGWLSIDMCLPTASVHKVSIVSPNFYRQQDTFLFRTLLGCVFYVRLVCGLSGVLPPVRCMIIALESVRLGEFGLMLVLP